jgi:light-regulated signal transduction histidine kinase (bacteriophytochrome)
VLCILTKKINKKHVPKKYDAVRILNQPLHLPQKIQAHGLCFFADNVSNSTIHAQAYICRNL